MQRISALWMTCVKAGGRGKMSARSEAIYSMWHNVFSSIAAIDSTDTAARIAEEEEMCPEMQFSRF